MENEDLIAEYMAYVKLDQGLSERTVRTYTETLQNYAKWLNGRPLASVRPKDVTEFGRRPRPRTSTPSANTVRRDVVAVRLLHQWCYENDHAEVRPVSTAVAPKVPKPHPKPIADDVWRALWGADLVDDDRLWLGLGYFCGLRRAEIVTIAPHEVKPQSGLMDFERKGGSYHALEYVECVESVDEELPWLTMGHAQRFLDILHETAVKRENLGATYLWYDSIGHVENDGNRLNKRLDRFLVPRHDLPPGSITPHMLRHSCATNLCRAGHELEFVQIQLSHSSIEITQRYMNMSGQMARRRAQRKLLMKGRDDEST